MFGKRDKSIPTLLVELKDLTINYTKQETLTPLKSLGRYIAFGVAGTAALSIGLLLWVMALLRALQNETGTTFTGNLTWAPYLLTLIACAVVIAAAAYAIGADKRRSQKRQQQRAEENIREAREARARAAREARASASTKESEVTSK